MHWYDNLTKVYAVFEGGGAKGIAYEGALTALHNKGYWFEGVAGAGELFFPVDLFGLFEAPAVEGAFGVGGLDEAAEYFAAVAVVVGDLLPDAGADDFARRHLLGERIEREAVQSGAGGRGVGDGHAVR